MLQAWEEWVDEMGWMDKTSRVNRAKLAETPI